jgi:hypothetical protein
MEQANTKSPSVLIWGWQCGNENIKHSTSVNSSVGKADPVRAFLSFSICHYFSFLTFHYFSFVIGRITCVVDAFLVFNEKWKMGNRLQACSGVRVRLPNLRIYQR